MGLSLFVLLVLGTVLIVPFFVVLDGIQRLLNYLDDKLYVLKDDRNDKFNNN